MSDALPTLMVAIENSVVFVKISGRATCDCSPHFKSLLLELIARGLKEFVLDLSDCVIMDSTFLGVLAKSGVLVGQQHPNNGSCNHVHLLNPNERVNNLIDNLGVLGYFDVLHDDRGSSHDYVAPESADKAVSKKELTETCLRAHEDLIQMNPRNAEKFKDVTSFLKNDLERMKQGAN